MDHSKIPRCPSELRWTIAAIVLLGFGYACVALLVPVQVRAQSAATGGEDSFQQIVDFSDAASVRRFTDRVPHRDLLSISRRTGPFIRGLCRSLETRAEARSRHTPVAGAFSLAGRRPSAAAYATNPLVEMAVARRICRAVGMVVISVDGMRVTCRLPGML